MVFVVDDLGAWLVGLIADRVRRRLATVVLGSVQERALRKAATEAVRLTADELRPGGDDRAPQLAMVINEVFSTPVLGSALSGQATLLGALQAGIAGQLAVLDHAGVTGTGQSSADVLGVSTGVLAKTLTSHLLREIVVDGSRGGPLFPLASQLNNDLTHLQGQQIQGTLRALGTEILEALARLDGARTAAAAGHWSTASRPVRLAPRPVFLAGREELLTELDAALSAGDRTEPRTVALWGLGGAGKTSVAVEYAHRQLAEVGLVWQFAAEDRAVLTAGFGELAAQLGVRDADDMRDPVLSVHGVLAASPADWLLVFDNAPDRAEVEAFLPPAGHGQVLITSQNQNWPSRQAVEVPVLGTGVAADFLVSRTGDPDRQAALGLAGELGGLPLALEQAAAYIQATGDRLAGYLASFRRRRPAMLGRGEPTGYRKTVATTWALAFARLERSEPEAAGLLRLLAFCAPEAIPLRLLLQPRPGLAGQLSQQVAGSLMPLLEDPLAAGDAIAALRRYSLISLPADGAVSVHRLVRAVTRDQIPAESAAAWQQAAGAVIEAAIPESLFNQLCERVQMIPV